MGFQFWSLGCQNWKWVLIATSVAGSLGLKDLHFDNKESLYPRRPQFWRFPNLEDFPNWPFHNFKTPWSGGRQILFISRTSFDGFWSSHIVKGSVGFAFFNSDEFWWWSSAIGKGSVGYEAYLFQSFLRNPFDRNYCIIKPRRPPSHVFYCTTSSIHPLIETDIFYNFRASTSCN